MAARVSSIGFEALLSTSCLDLLHQDWSGRGCGDGDGCRRCRAADPTGHVAGRACALVWSCRPLRPWWRQPHPWRQRADARSLCHRGGRMWMQCMRIGSVTMVRKQSYLKCMHPRWDRRSLHVLHVCPVYTHARNYHPCRYHLPGSRGPHPRTLRARKYPPRDAACRRLATPLQPGRNAQTSISSTLRPSNLQIGRPL